jgi:hypothetical protein
MTTPGPGSCAICDGLAIDDLAELDLLLGDPRRWPANVWGIFETPKGPVLPPQMKRWGAARLGQQWLIEHGYNFRNQRWRVAKHYREDTPKIAVDPDELVQLGLLVRGGKASPNATINPLGYLEFYNEGIKAGKKGIELLMAYVAKLEKDEAAIPLPLIKLLVDVGAKLATSQAMIKSREPSQPELGDDDDAFRINPPGQRIGHQRVRMIEGQSTVVRDEGPKDRAAYNERARQEGSPTL